MQLAQCLYIPVAFQVATLLAAFAHPDHLLLVGSLGFAYLLPSSNLKCFGYRDLLFSKFCHLELGRAVPEASSWDAFEHDLSNIVCVINYWQRLIISLKPKTSS
ncbi:MAG: hypothetical protein QS721_09320 [Candidatus Endonucleobacter sp. (ex Gigantidas childressi)]|nr:hypothetical protein [Candidatus Endonucleobacter sp. (ex Gigantidas childressi)]